jgi:glycosyltransferase involved in cell wall biosynthesis
MLKISVIVPIYNVREYIERCIKSILIQECKDFDMECILVNDCTPDDSMDIVNTMIANYHGGIVFKVMSHDKNKGLSAARNTGLLSAVGDFVFFVDSDDNLLHGALRNLVARLKNVGGYSDVDVVVGNSYVCKNNQPAMKFGDSLPLVYDNNDETALRKLLNRELFHTAWNKLIRRDFLINNNILFQDGILDEDLLWSYFLFLKARKILVVPQISYLYEDNPSSIMNTSSSKIAKLISSRITICNKILDAPPQMSYVEYYMYVFFILTRALNVYGLNKHEPAVCQLETDLFKLRDRLFENISAYRYPLLYLFFLTAKEPFCKISDFYWFRRYYDNISRLIRRVSNGLIHK